MDWLKSSGEIQPKFKELILKTEVAENKIVDMVQSDLLVIVTYSFCTCD